MKRIVAALLLWVVVLGGLDFYMKRFMTSVAGSSSHQSHQTSRSQELYAMEVTTTFSVEPDPFALNTETSSESPALLVRLADHEVLRLTGEVDAGVPIRISPVPGMGRNLNEFYVEANMPLDSGGRDLALRLRLLKDGRPVAEKTFWSEGENKIAGTFQVSLEEEKEGGEKRHDEH